MHQFVGVLDKDADETWKHQTTYTGDFVLVLFSHSL